jgi:hypothetical protein
MYRQIVIVVVSIVILGAATEQATAQQLLSSNADTEMLSKRFAQSIIEGDFVNGARELQMFAIMDTVAVANAMRALPDLIAKHVVANGPLIEVDLISSTTKGKTFIRHAYALKSQRGALRCVVVFYKGSKGWAVHSFTIDDRIQDELNK